MPFNCAIQRWSASLPSLLPDETHGSKSLKHARPSLRLISSFHFGVPFSMKSVWFTLGNFFRNHSPLLTCNFPGLSKSLNLVHSTLKERWATNRTVQSETPAFVITLVPTVHICIEERTCEFHASAASISSVRHNVIYLLSLGPLFESSPIRLDASVVERSENLQALRRNASNVNAHLEN